MPTKYDALIAIANKLAGHDVSGQHPRTVAGAIDAITDTLAGADVNSGMTIADAIGSLAPYVNGGGGGLPELGDAVPIWVLDSYTPPKDNPFANSLKAVVGGETVAELLQADEVYAEYIRVASGAVASIALWDADEDAPWGRSVEARVIYRDDEYAYYPGFDITSLTLDPDDGILTLTVPEVEAPEGMLGFVTVSGPTNLSIVLDESSDPGSGAYIGTRTKELAFIAFPGYVASGTNLAVLPNEGSTIVSASYSVDGGQPVAIVEDDGAWPFTMPSGGRVTVTVKTELSGK